MSLESDLDRDIRQFFQQTNEMRDEDKISSLKLLLDKYIHISRSDYLMDKYDFETIKQNAQNLLKEYKLPKQFQNSFGLISGNEAVALSIIEGTVQFLISRDCLKRSPKFKYGNK